MSEHTTHFDDCGCKSAKYEAENARLRAALESVKKNESAWALVGHHSVSWHIANDALEATK